MGRRHESLIALSHQHHHGLALAQQIELRLGRGVDPGSLVTEAVAFHDGDLRPHFVAEETVLFPAMERELGALPLVPDLCREHQALHGIVDQLRAAADAERATLLRRFAAALRDHIKKEENELFPIFESKLPASLASALGAQLREALAPPGAPAG